jgi:hypothetical protein
MRQCSLGAVAAAMILVLSLFVFLPLGTGAHDVRHSIQAPAPLATDFVFALNAAGAVPPAFLVGYTAGAVYFRAFDPSDSKAVVQINDQNASRDGLSNPVASWTVNIVGGSNNSTLWNGFYLIPLTLKLGGQWNITIGGAVAGFSATKFQVLTYTLTAFNTAPAFLPGHSGNARYYANWTVNNAPYTRLTSLTATASYLTTAGTTLTLPGFPKTLPVSGWGNFSFTVPTNARTFTLIAITIFANTSAGTYPNSLRTTDNVPVAYISNPTVTLGSCPFGCAATTFTAGSPVYVGILAYLVAPGVGFVPAIGLQASLQFATGAVPFHNPGAIGNPPANITISENGQAAVLFVANVPPFSTTTFNGVTVTVRDLLIAQNTPGTTTADFTLTTSVPPPVQLTISLDHSQFYGGDTVTATWQLGGYPSSVPATWTVDGWWAWEQTTGVLIATGTAPPNATSASFSFTIPSSYVGTIAVVVSAHNATAGVQSKAFAGVSMPAILLTPSETAYLPGDGVTVSVVTQGQILSTAALYGTVEDPNGVFLFNGPVSNGQFSFSIPKVGAPAAVTITVSAQTSLNGVVSQATLTLSETSGFVLLLGIQTISNYADGSFQPGQTIQVQYTLVALGVATYPKQFTIVVSRAGSDFFGPQYGATIFQTTQPSGTIGYTIPSNTLSGTQDIPVVACLGGSPTCPGGTFPAFLSVFVEKNPSFLQYELGAGSGVTVGWAILLAAIVLLALVGFILLWRRRGARLGPTKRMEAVQPYIPPEAAPSAPTGPTEPKWRELSGSTESMPSSDSPPLPPPAT